MSTTTTTTTTTTTPVFPPYFLYGAIIVIPIYYVCYWFANKILLGKYGTKNLKNKFNNLNKDKQIEFIVLFPSTVHAIVQSFGYPMFIALGYSMNHNMDKIAYYDTKWPAFYQGIFAGYMVADYVKNGYKILGLGLTIHHTTAFLAWTLSAYLQTMQWQTSLLQFCELSTIVLNLRQFLLTTGYDGTIMTIVNLTFMGSFTIVRVVPLPMILKELYNTGFIDMKNKDGLIMAIGGTVFTLIHAGLQLTWFSFMVKKLISKLIKTDNNNNNIMGRSSTG